MGRIVYLPPQPRPDVVRYQRRDWAPLVLVGGLVLLAGVAIAVIVLTNPSL